MYSSSTICRSSAADASSQDFQNHLTRPGPRAWFLDQLNGARPKCALLERPHSQDSAHTQSLARRCSMEPSRNTRLWAEPRISLIRATGSVEFGPGRTNGCSSFCVNLKQRPSRGCSAKRWLL